MFEEYLVLTDSFENTYKNGTPDGFRFRIRPACDRGIWLSLLGGFYAAVDNEPAFPQDAMTLAIEDGPVHPVPELASCSQERWNPQKTAWLTIQKPGGLSAGPHTLAFQEVLLTGYFKAKEEWVTDPPLPGQAGPITAFSFSIPAGQPAGMKPEEAQSADAESEETKPAGSKPEGAQPADNPHSV